MEKSKRVFGLDVLRAAAVTGVVISHGFNLITPAGRVLVERFLFMPAYFGVELFFVLSGFLIGSILLQEKQTESFAALRRFWSRRWFRTLPNYYFAMLLCLICLCIQRETSELHPRDLLDLLFLQNFAWPHSEFFGHSWSLAVEEWFYLLFPMGILLLRKLRMPFATAFVTAAILSIFGPTLAKVVALWLHPSLFWAAHFWKIVVFRLDAVMFGVLAAYFNQRVPALWEKYRMGFLTLSCLVIAGVLACFEGWIPLSKTWFCLFICPATSLGFALCLPFFGHYRSSGDGPVVHLITNVALYSYSIYLLHPLVFAGLEWIVNLYTPGLGIRYGLMGILMVVSYLVSKANYHWFEKPMMDLRDRR